MVKAHRYPENPIITPADIEPSIKGWEVLCAFNAGVIKHGGEIVLLMRVAEKPITVDKSKVPIPYLDVESDPQSIKVMELDANSEHINLEDPRVVIYKDNFYLTTISHLRIARSTDGRVFTVDRLPALYPDQDYEVYGMEDPRITFIDDTYYVVYKGVAPMGITQCLASTKDFVTWTKHGIIFCPENMDAMLFPQKIGGKYAALHRPQPKVLGSPNMWMAYSDDLIHWGEHKFLMGCSKDTWESGRIGGGAVPFLTSEGWIEIYHAATEDNHYCLGAVLLDRDNPEKIIAKTSEPILKPEAPYETDGFMKNVVFSCGALVDNDVVTIYYGASDECIAAADLSLKSILSALEPIEY